MNDAIIPIKWENDQLQLIDQRVLPQEYNWLSYNDAPSVAQAITDMVVRGAPAIGITAAFGVVLAARAAYEQSVSDWKNIIKKDMDLLAASRPTAVNLFWALERMGLCIHTIDTNPVPVLLSEAQKIHEEDIQANKTMGDLGASLLKDKCSVITHCNAGALATGGYGTALGVIRSAWREGKIERVYADETRPWLQGSRLTAWEMVQENIPVTLLCDGASAHRMKQGGIGWVIVGSDRIAGNGDVANKIGTYHLAIAAKYHGVKVMVAAPTSTIDMSIKSGVDIPIEQRGADEILSLGGKRIAAEGAEAWNQAFDVTPANLVDAIVTEKGVVEHPTAEKMVRLMGQ
ncbi:MAG: S-methyl-5-thioribose-1-phosphate isomerase [Gammaproteobacteria bacterium]|nr:S-methyl-5-thioribose-1-phosphate isomerase [Gammaproteobacteria bacterium]